MRKRSLLSGTTIIVLLMLAGPFSANAGKGKHKHKAPFKYEIAGDITAMPEQLVVLEFIRANDSVSAADSQRSNATGHFSFTGTAAEAGFYRLHFTDNRFILLSVDEGKIAITSSWPIND